MRPPFRQRKLSEPPFSSLGKWVTIPSISPTLSPQWSVPYHRWDDFSSLPCKSRIKEFESCLNWRKQIYTICWNCFVKFRSCQTYRCRRVNFGLLCVQCSEVEHPAIGYSKTQFIGIMANIDCLFSLLCCRKPLPQLQEGGGEKSVQECY